MYAIQCLCKFLTPRGRAGAGICSLVAFGGFWWLPQATGARATQRFQKGIPMACYGKIAPYKPQARLLSIYWLGDLVIPFFEVSSEVTTIQYT